MRILFLNTWNGKAGKVLPQFIFDEASKIDIFCLQEVEKPLFVALEKLLPNFEGKLLIKPAQGEWFFNQAIFYRKDLKIKISDSDFLQGSTGQSALAKFNNDDVLICNIHGVALPGDKHDTPERLTESGLLIDFARRFEGPKIIGGDFNLLPTTQSIKIIEKAGYKNLIKEFKIKETRNKLAWGHYKDEPGFVRQHFADYCFVSPEIKVKNFEVQRAEISDHEPMILDFEV